MEKDDRDMKEGGGESPETDAPVDGPEPSDEGPGEDLGATSQGQPSDD